MTAEESTTNASSSSGGADPKVARAAEASSQDLIAEATRLLKGFRIAAARVSDTESCGSGLDRLVEDTSSAHEESSPGASEGFYLTKVVKEPPKGARGLLDGGATNSLRTAKSQKEIEQCTLTQVSLALGHAELLLTPVGTLISAEPVAPIVPMGVLAAELDCKVNWEGETCRVIHPKRGKLPIVMVNRCPELCAKITEELIAEIEDKRALVMQRALRLKAIAVGVGQQGIDEPVSVDAMLEWLQKLSPDCPKGILARVPPVWQDDLEGEDVPFNRRVRRAVQRADKVVLHLFSGRTKPQDFGQWPSSVYVLSVDLERGLDILSDGLYQYLLELCSSGKVIAVVGGPPCATFSRLRERGEQDGGPRVLRDRTGPGRFGTLTKGTPLTRGEQRTTDAHTVMYFRMFLLHHVAHGASEEGVCFVLENPADPAEYLKDGAEHASLWAWPEIKFLEREKGMFRASFSQGALGHCTAKPTTLLANDWGLHLELHGRKHPSGGFGETQASTLQDRMLQSQSWAKWAHGLTRAIGRAVLKWVTTPALERQRTMQVEQACVRTLSQNDRAFIEHCERDHLGYRRDCQTCLASSVRSHLHLRQKYQHRNAFTLNVDLIGPLKPGEDQLGKARHLLVGVLGVPLFRKGRPQPLLEGDETSDHPIPAEWADDDAEGHVPADADDPFQVETPPEEEEVSLELDPDWKARAQRWNDRWKATIATLTEPVEVVPLVFVEPISSKRASVTLRGLQRIYTGIRLLNYTVRRIHSDSGREFANSLLEKWALSRDIALTASVPSDPKSNGRVEGVVGRCKAGIRGLMIQSGFSADSWPHLARQWGEQKLRHGLAKLGAEPPKRPLVPSGTVVTVKKREWSRKTPWSSKALQGVAVAPSVRVPNATVIRVQDQGESKLYVAPVVYTHVKEPVRFVGTAHVEDLEDLPAPGRRVVGKSPGVLHPHGLSPWGESGGGKGGELSGGDAGDTAFLDRDGACDDAIGDGVCEDDGSGAGVIDFSPEGEDEALDASAPVGSSADVRVMPIQRQSPDRYEVLGSPTVHAVLSQSEKDHLLSLDCWTPVQAERYCQHLLLQDGPPKREEVESILRRSLQDFRAKSRAVDVAAKGVGARAWTLGFFVYGNKVGLTNRTKLMPNMVKLLNRYLGSLVSSQDDHNSWAALRVTWGMQAGPHSDRNMKDSEWR